MYFAVFIVFFWFWNVLGTVCGGPKILENLCFFRGGPPAAAAALYTPAPQHPRTPAPQHPSTPAPQHRSTPAPQHPTPHHPNTPAPQQRSTPACAFQKTL